MTTKPAPGRHVCFAEAGGPVERITDQAVAAARAHFARRISAMRRAITEAADLGSALRAFLDLAARWTPDALGALVAQAMELAALEGREAIFAEADAAFAEPDFTVRGFDEQMDYLRQKRPRPTRAWTDALHGDHDRSFVVAGVTDLAMLEEFKTAMIEAAPTRDFKGFAAEFDRLVEKYGWSYNGGREWRIRTIFETNIRTSYMAGRLRQLRDPDLVKLQPYWMYRHGDTRVPKSPRPTHLAWDGLVLNWDDPWWEVHFPPNDWKCSCGVHGVTRAGLRRMGKDAPDKAPPIIRKPYTHKASGQTVMLPEGVGFGWDHMPGDLWEKGLVPSALIEDPAARPTGDAKGHHLVSIDEAEPVADMIARARPFEAQVLPEGLPRAAYVEALLKPFGSNDGEAVLWQDPTGARIVLSGDMFFNAEGAWKGGKRGHATHAALIAEALSDPDEIWLGVREVPVAGFPGQTEAVVTRRYVRVDPKNGLSVLFEMGRRLWREITGFAALNRAKPDHRYIDDQRVGKLLWKRK